MLECPGAVEAIRAALAPQDAQEKSPVISRRSARMQLKDIMTSGVEVIAPEATLQAAARKMQRMDVGPLPVCDGDRLVGMLTDRDITIRAVAEGCDPTTTTVREAMTPDMVYCFEDQEVQ
jgi:CBS domain-containing protein